MTKNNKTGFITLSIGAAALGIAACGVIENPEDPIDPQVGDPAASVRVFHSVPDAPAVDVYVAGVADPVVTGLEFGQSTGLLSVAPGSYQFEVRAAGAEATSVPLISSEPLELSADNIYTAVAAGLLDGSGNNDQLRILALDGDFDSPAPDSATVRLLHAAPDAPTVALDLGDDGSIEYENIERFQTTSTGGVQIRAEQEHQLAIYAGSPLARVTAFTIPPLARGSQLFMVATGRLASEGRADDGFSVIALPPQSSTDGEATRIRQNPIVYVVHAGADAPAVDIDAGGATLVSNISFGNISAPIQVPPGDYDLEIFPAGAGGAPVASTHTPDLIAGYEFLAVATGFLAPSAGEANFEVLYFADEFALDDPHSARLRAVHASPDAPAVDISPITLSGQLATPLLESGVSFGEAGVGEGLSVPVAALRIGVAAAGSPNPVASFDITTAPAQRAFVLAAGALGGGLGRTPFRLLAVDTTASQWSIASVTPVVSH